MNTEHKTKLKKRMKQDNKKFIIKIQTLTPICLFVSEFESIEEALHKVELDLMTNLHHNFQTPIKIIIKEIDV